MDQTNQIEYSDQSTVMDFTDIKNEIDIISNTSNLSSKQSQYGSVHPNELKSLSWHEKLRIQTQHPMNDTFTYKNIQYAHTNGLRNSIQFQQKDYYTFEELLIMINRIDEAWENSLNTKSNYSYID
jgi:hypothetical protein